MTLQPHEDGPSYYPNVATISLGSHAIFHYYQYRLEDGDPQTQTAPLSTSRPIDPIPVASILLEPRSLVITSEAMYTNRLHGIDDVTHDKLARHGDDGLGGEKIDPTEDKGVFVANWELLGDESMKRAAEHGDILARETRTSLTCRLVEKTLPSRVFGRSK